MPTHLLSVALGGALGACARYLVGRGMARLTLASHWPWATLVVNVAGSLVLGWLLAAQAAGRLRSLEALPLDARLLFGVGFLGAFTTFSTFAYETVEALRAGHTAVAITNVAANAALSLIACAVGIALGSR